MEVINNIHRRILNISAKFKNSKIKKSGYNKFSGFNYFELSDIQPVLIDLMLEEGVGAIYSIDEKVAEATFINLDDPKDRATFKVPMGEANLKGTQDMQNKGACITYARRYLLLLAFNIVEPDQLDAVSGDPKFKVENKKVKEKFPTSDQIRNCKDYDTLRDLYIEVREYANYLRASENKKVEP